MGRITKVSYNREISSFYPELSDICDSGLNTYGTFMGDGIISDLAGSNLTGVYQQLYIGKYDNGYSVLVTTCFFVIYHYNNPVNMLLSFAMGLVFAHMVIKAKGILPAIIFHIGINLLGQIVLPAIILN